MVCWASDTVKVWVTGIAAASFPEAGAVAVMEHVPADTVIANDPETMVQTAGVFDVKVTDSWELAEANSETVTPTP